MDAQARQTTTGGGDERTLRLVWLVTRDASEELYVHVCEILHRQEHLCLDVWDIDPLQSPMEKEHFSKLHHINAWIAYCVCMCVCVYTHSDWRWVRWLRWPGWRSRRGLLEIFLQQESFFFLLLSAINSPALTYFIGNLLASSSKVLPCGVILRGQ